ncbi:MAG: hypothetical protein ACLQIB_46175 [Isosphaeraceae bacterium]
MRKMSSHLPKTPSGNWTRHVPESMSRALERRHMLDTQQRAFQRDSGSPHPSANPRPRRPS